MAKKKRARRALKDTRTQVTITGRDFHPNATVTFGPAGPAQIISQTTTEIVCWAPTYNIAGQVQVAVTNPDGQTHDIGFTYFFQPPFITGINPTSGPCG
jgi:hypothetical protein